MDLGTLCWWSVNGDPNISDHDLAGLVRETIPEVKPPATILPVDAFRRMTGGEATAHSYTIGAEPRDQLITLSLANVTAPQKTMLNRAILRAVASSDGVQQRVDKVGDLVFYKPPRGQHDKARVRVTLVPGITGLLDVDRIRAYGDTLRNEYRRAVKHVNGQAVRRIVRAYLTAIGAVPMDGPYFIEEVEDADRLREFLVRVGNCRCTHFVIDDRPWHRDQVTEFRKDPPTS